MRCGIDREGEIWMRDEVGIGLEATPHSCSLDWEESEDGDEAGNEGKI